MSSFLYGLARSAYRRRGVVLAIWLTVAVLVGAFAAVAADKFQENFSLPGTESQAALDTLKRTFPQSVGTTAQVVIVAPEGKTVRDADVKQQILDSGKRFEKINQVDGVTTPFDKYAKDQISDDGSAGIMTVRLSAGQGEIKDTTYDAMEAETAALQKAIPGSTTSIGGEAYSNNTPGLSLVEGLGVVIALFVLADHPRLAAGCWHALADGAAGRRDHDRTDLRRDRLHHRVIDHTVAVPDARSRGRHRLRAVHRVPAP